MPLNIPESVTIKPDAPAIFLTTTEVKRGQNQGALFAEIDWTKTKVEDCYKAWPADELDEWIKTKFRQLTRALTGEALGEDGTFDSELFLKMFRDLSARGESLADIVERYQEVTSQATSCILAAQEGNLSPEAAAAKMAEGLKLMKVGMKLKSDMETKRREKQAKQQEKAAEAAAGVTNA